MCAAFENRKFRRLLAGRVVTNFGDSVYFVAAMWLVYDLTGNPFYTGLAGFLTLTPAAFQFLAGPLADRWRVRRTLVGTQFVQCVVVLTIPIAHHLDVLTVGLVLLVMPVLASLNQLANPSMVTALPRLLDDDELVGANSALAIAKQGVDMIGYGVSGVLMGAFGAITLFALDAVTFAFAAVLFATVAVPATTAPDPGDVGSNHSRSDCDGESMAGASGDETQDDAAYLTQLRLGLAFLRGTFLVWLIVGVAFVNFAAGMTLAVMPAYADTLTVPTHLVTLGGTGAYGILMAAFATGNLLGAVAANLVTDRPLGQTLAVGLTAGGGCWITAIAADWLLVTALLLTGAFVPISIVNVQIAALVQSAPPEAVVGRVTSVLGSATAATLPVGSFVGGAVAGVTDPATVMLFVGFGLFALAGYVLAIPALRSLPMIDQINVGPA